MFESLEVTLLTSPVGHHDKNGSPKGIVQQGKMSSQESGQV